MAGLASLDMGGHIDDVFSSGSVARTRIAGGYVDGIYQESALIQSIHKATIQPVSDRERQTIEIGGQRLVDARKVYISDGSIFDVLPSDRFALPDIGGVFEAIKSDIRSSRTYVKLILSRVDS